LNLHIRDICLLRAIPSAGSSCGGGAEFLFIDSRTPSKKGTATGAIEWSCSTPVLDASCPVYRFEEVSSGPYDVVVDTIGGDYELRSIKLLKPKGHFAHIIQLRLPVPVS